MMHRINVFADLVITLSKQDYYIYIDCTVQEVGVTQS